MDSMFKGSSDHYLSLGLSALNVIEAAMIGTAAPRTILDLPSGFGQVTRMLRARYPEAAITVCDFDQEGVDFSAAAFGARGVHCTPDFRDLKLGGTFDLIWVGSLLTRLPEHQTRQFLDFAARHMGPDSRLVITSHGEFVATQLRTTTYGLSEDGARGLLSQYLVDGYAYRGYDGDDASYGISLGTRSWYETLFAGSSLCLQSYHERGWDRHQDVLVLRRAPEVTGNGPVPLFERRDILMPPSAGQQSATDAAIVTGFDEAWYLNAFPDVANAVRDGVCPSGLWHYMTYGWKEGRPPFDPQRTYANRMAPVPAAWFNGIAGGANRVNETWSVSPEDQAEDLGWYWMAHPAVRARSNILASGNAEDDAYAHLAELLKARGWRFPIARALSIGCGFGGLERDLAARGLVRDIDGYDIAAGAIVEARRLAEQQGFENLRYHVADLEAIELPPSSLDVVFAHSSVHHVERLEALYTVVQRALRPGGIFHLHEFVGPTRFQWTDEQLRLANAFLDSLPPRLRRQPNGQPKENLRRPFIAEMIAADPSEAIRSADLVTALEPYFDIIEYRPLGGSLAHIALGGIAQNFDFLSPQDNAFLQQLFEMEDRAMANGIITSDFAVITATPKPVTAKQ